MDDSRLKLLLISRRWDIALFRAASELTSKFDLLVLTTDGPTALSRFFPKLQTYLTATRLLFLTRIPWIYFFWPASPKSHPRFADLITIIDHEAKCFDRHRYDTNVAILVDHRSDPSLLRNLEIPLVGTRYGLPSHGSNPYSFKKTLASRNYNNLYATTCLLRSSGEVESVLNGQHVSPNIFEPYFLFQARAISTSYALLNETLSLWPFVTPIPAPSSIPVQSTPIRKTLVKGLRLLFDLELFRYSLYQRYPSGLLYLSDSVTKFLNPVSLVDAPDTTHRVTKHVARIVARTYRRAGAKITLAVITRRHIPNGFYVLNYHQICDDSTAKVLSSTPNLSQIFTSSGNFLSHLDFFKDNFLCLPLSEGLKLWKEGHAARSRVISLTFDDGLVGPVKFLNDMNSISLQPGFFVCGDPLIRNRPLGVHRSLLIADYSSRLRSPDNSLETSFNMLVDFGQCDNDRFAWFIRRQYLSADTLSALLRDGRIDALGSHTWSHETLAHRNLETQSREISNCHLAIERRLNTKINLFSYPFGKMNRQSYMTQLLAHSTAEQIFHCNGGINLDPASGPSVLRVSVKNHSVDELHRLLRLQCRR